MLKFNEKLFPFCQHHISAGIFPTYMFQKYFSLSYMQFLLLKFNEKLFPFCQHHISAVIFQTYIYVSEVPTVKILGRPESGVLVVEEGRELSLICQVA
jgi:hypothetical protein